VDEVEDHELDAELGIDPDLPAVEFAAEGSGDVEGQDANPVVVFDPGLQEGESFFKSLRSWLRGLRGTSDLRGRFVEPGSRNSASRSVFYAT
jgi:hypothetical protein